MQFLQDARTDKTHSGMPPDLQFEAGGATAAAPSGAATAANSFSGGARGASGMETLSTVSSCRGPSSLEDESLVRVEASSMLPSCGGTRGGASGVPAVWNL